MGDIGEQALPRPWRAWWGLMIMLPVTGLANAFLLFFAFFCGRSGWGLYVAALLIWCLPLLPFMLDQAAVGLCIRRLAKVLVVGYAGLWLLLLPGLLQNPGWQF